MGTRAEPLPSHTIPPTVDGIPCVQVFFREGWRTRPPSMALEAGAVIKTPREGCSDSSRNPSTSKWSAIVHFTVPPLGVLRFSKNNDSVLLCGVATARTTFVLRRSKNKDNVCSAK